METVTSTERTPDRKKMRMTVNQCVALITQPHRPPATCYPPPCPSPLTHLPSVFSSIPVNSTKTSVTQPPITTENSTIGHLPLTHCFDHRIFLKGE
ncbi:hypothetical protein Hamer_G011328 [Homarus americanus]|uniref:Uncharacterized protein n=1 Tax=Homarus americanus TaxID=6706 RepID=A0A8J5JT17_HOMAM|nr:hypothetical protein Hamer_G011328 [Homarus americanus]